MSKLELSARSVQGQRVMFRVKWYAKTDDLQDVAAFLMSW